MAWSAPGNGRLGLKGIAAYQGYRWLARFAEVVPRSSIPFVSRVAARIGVLILPGKRRLVSSHLARVNGQRPHRASVRRAFASYVAYWLEALRLPSFPSESLNDLVRVQGFDHVESARDQGKGVVVALAHLGNWDVGGRWLIESGVPLVVVAERLRPPQLHTWFTDFRESLGFEVLVNGPNIASEITEALRNNKVVALLCDRDVDGTGRPVDFFGEQTNLPAGPAILALRTGAAVVPVGIYADRSGYRVDIKAPLSVQRSNSFRTDVQHLHKQIVSSLEQLIARDPEQWHLFGPNWPSDGRLTS